MRSADIVLDIHQKRGAKGLHLERVYKHLLNPELFLRAYGKIYRNTGAMTKGTTAETVDGMCLQKILAIIEQLRLERYQWEPVRRVEIPKSNGKMRPLGIPRWSDKLVQEALRMLLEPYYEQRFSTHSHGFRPNRGCHSALREILKTWHGTVWFIEGDIKGCFDNIGHKILLEIIQRDIHDGRLVRLMETCLEAGYMEDWVYYNTTSGTPQGGIISPLLANVYLNELDRFVEDTLIPTYTRGEVHQRNPRYMAFTHQIEVARRRGDRELARRLVQERRQVPCIDPVDPGYRRLRYIRYADDFLLGFVGPKSEAEEIRGRLGDFLQQRLKLTLSQDKTFITHANDEQAKFLGYEIKVVREGSLITKGRRATNGSIALRIPRAVAQKYIGRYCKKGKPVHRSELLCDRAYTIVRRYQSVLRGLYNYYCMAVNVSSRMCHIRQVLEISLTKTLAHKFKLSVRGVYKKFKGIVLDDDLKTRKVIRAIAHRKGGKEPLVAIFGGFPIRRIPEGMGNNGFNLHLAWFSAGSNRSEAVDQMLAGKCELCGAEGVPSACTTSASYQISTGLGGDQRSPGRRSWRHG